MGGQGAFKIAVRHMHRQKDAAYGNSWKRRGELISIMANVARKVDRLESIANGASASQDESTLDTAIDLLVYGLKYMTFLADQDAEVAASIFPGTTPSPSCSDGPLGFEQLLEATDLSAVYNGPAPTVTDAANLVVNRFTQLEGCFEGVGTTTSPIARSQLVERLVNASSQLIGALRVESPRGYDLFLTIWSD